MFRQVPVTALLVAMLAVSGQAQPPDGPLPRRHRPPGLALDSTQPFRAYIGDGPTAKESRFLIERIDPETTLKVVAGRPTVLRFRTPPFRDQVGDPEIAELVSISESEISVIGKKVGTTTVNLWFKDPSTGNQEVLSYLLRVVEDPEEAHHFAEILESLERDINRDFLGSVVDLGYVGKQVVVRGKAKDIEAASHILRIVAQSLPEQDPKGREVQRDESNQTVAPLVSDRGAAELGQANVQSTFLATQSIPNVQELGGLNNAINGSNIVGANATQINNRIVNMLEIAGIHQVMLKVTLAEVVRDSGRSLISTTRFGVDSDTTSDISFTQSLGVGQLTFQTEQFFLQFDALKRLGLARSLSEPNLTTLSGQSANFLVGGQFPVLESSSTVAAVNQSIRFVPFGVQLSVLPTVTDGDRIRLQLQSTVSETANGIGVGGAGAGGVTNNDPSTPPSLSTRSFTSTVELRDGESLALAGLIRNSLVNSSARVPFLGDVPVIGNLFANNQSTYQEQELMVVVTPYLVSPLPSGATLPLPGCDTFEPDDLEFYLHGSIEGSIAEDYRTPVRGNLHRMEAFRRTEQKYIIGMPGHSSGRPLPELQLPSQGISGITTRRIVQ